MLPYQVFQESWGGKSQVDWKTILLSSIKGLIYNVGPLLRSRLSAKGPKLLSRESDTNQEDSKPAPLASLESKQGNSSWALPQFPPRPNGVQPP